MSGLDEWLAAREPSPPDDLGASLRSAAGELRGALPAGADGGEALALAEALSSVARARLQHAVARPGRTRASAFRLLEADALLTYACEAALDAEDPDAALHRILAATA